MHAPSEQGLLNRTTRPALEVPGAEDAWVLPEEDMPESNTHRDAVRLLEQILLAFVARTGRDALVAANLACRWDPLQPRVGVDPDVALLEPAPPESPRLQSLRTWEPGHVPPRFAVEVVSASNPAKDYQDSPAKYAALGTREVVLFDPDLLGPASTGGPYVLQVWRRDVGGAMVRVYAGEGPARSDELGAWLVALADGHLRIADDERGAQLWLTQAEMALATARAAIEDFCDVIGVPLDEGRRAHLISLDATELEALRVGLKRTRTWPV